MGSNLGHGAFIAPTKDDVTLAWAGVRVLKLNGYEIYPEAISKVLQAYERIAALVPRENDHA